MANRCFDQQPTQKIINVASRNDGTIAIDGFLTGTVALTEEIGNEKKLLLLFSDLSPGKIVNMSLLNNGGAHIFGPLQIKNLNKQVGSAELSVPVELQ